MYNVRPQFSVAPGTFISNYFSSIVKCLYDIDSAALIGVLAGFNDPEALFLMTLEESVPLVVAFFLNMVSLRDVVERIFTYSQIISLHVVVKSFFVCKIPVKL